MCVQKFIIGTFIKSWHANFYLLMMYIFLLSLACCKGDEQLNSINGCDIMPIIEKSCTDRSEDCQIDLRNFDDFNWQHFNLLPGPMMENDVSKYLGLNYTDIIPDGTRRLIFISNNEVVCQHDYKQHIRNKSTIVFDRTSYKSIVKSHAVLNIVREKTEQMCDKCYLYVLREVKK